MPDAFEPNRVEHTFRSGRTMVVRRSLPLQVLMFKAVDDGDEEVAEGLALLFNASQSENGDEPGASIHTAGKIMRGIVKSMFLEPRVYWDDTDSVDGGIPVEDLYTDEIEEVMELAMEAVTEAGRFRGDESGADGGDDRKGVAQKPKRTAGAKPRKR